MRECAWLRTARRLLAAPPMPSLSRLQQQPVAALTEARLASRFDPRSRQPGSSAAAAAAVARWLRCVIARAKVASSASSLS